MSPWHNPRPEHGYAPIWQVLIVIVNLLAVAIAITLCDESSGSTLCSARSRGGCDRSRALRS
jgi:hypothetical protein